MDAAPVDSVIAATSPLFMQHATEIAHAVRDVDDIAQFMKVSPSIATTVQDMYRQWGDAVKPSMYMYRGDVYKGFYADTLGTGDIQWAQDHIMIASGLYGLLRPLDKISRYRLEMRAQLSVTGHANLYDFWGDQLATAADERANGTICILSSEEYARPIRKFATSRIVTPVFMDHKPNGTIGQVPIYSKMMRGVMARWIIDNRVDTPEGLVPFDRFGYVHDASRSTSEAPVFLREKMIPLVF